MILDGLLPGASRARDQALAWRAPQPEDVDHRLRAALDALACQVAQHPCGAPTGGALHDALAALRGVSSGRLTAAAAVPRIDAAVRIVSMHVRLAGGLRGAAATLHERVNPAMDAWRRARLG